MLRIAQEALTFDDVLLVPAHSTVLPNSVDLHTHLTKNIVLNIPMVSAAMDTVTGAELAIALAQEGGIGFIHKNMSIEDQCEAVQKVKRYESGMVVSPITISPTSTVADVIALTKKNGFGGYPVVDENGELEGLITSRDVKFITDPYNTLVCDAMTPKARLVTATASTSREEIQALMQKHKIEKVLIVDKDFKLSGMITVRDFEKAERKPNACKDAFGRLRVGGAVGAGAGNEKRICMTEEVFIPGPHNLENALGAVCVAAAMNVPVPVIRHSLKTFRGVEHRIETVRELDGVEYINDSKGTNVDSTIKAVQTMSQPTVIILGGYDKHTSFDPLSREIINSPMIRHAVLIGETAGLIRNSLERVGFNNLTDAGSMHEAVEAARKLADKGWCVLLSPACASFDMFKDYEERGRVFKQIVQELK